RAAALNSLALAELSAGDRGAARARATEALELSRAVGDRHGEAAVHSNLADILHAAGPAEGARARQPAAAAVLPGTRASGRRVAAGDLEAVGVVRPGYPTLARCSATGPVMPFSVASPSGSNRTDGSRHDSTQVVLTTTSPGPARPEMRAARFTVRP